MVLLIGRVLGIDIGMTPGTVGLQYGPPTTPQQVGEIPPPTLPSPALPTAQSSSFTHRLLHPVGSNLGPQDRAQNLVSTCGAQHEGITKHGPNKLQTNGQAGSG